MSVVSASGMAEGARMHILHAFAFIHGICLSSLKKSRAESWQMFELSHLGALLHTNGSVQLAEGYDTAYPGICDPMPGWNVTWNPPDCNTQVTPDVRGMMPSAAWHQVGGTTEALAVPAMMSNEVDQVAPKGTTSKASPGHLVLCGHAALMGAWMATSDALDRKGGTWFESFKQHTQAAANAVTPVGGKVLETHVFKQEQ
eukprot:766835-Hanusia_phi.AAC.1